ncbi:MAG: thioredoxin family protein [Armatimonadota bacterium]|nr:thioredoxin family protein [Armatimonadota bacterium]
MSCNLNRAKVYASAVAVLMSLCVAPLLAATVAPEVGSPAPCFNTSLSQLAVKDANHKAIGGSLADKSSGFPMVLYFWSSQDPRCERELSVLSRFRQRLSGIAKFVVVAFPAYGDEKNAKNRAKVPKGLDIVFDDGRKLYSEYCPPDKSHSKSAFLIDPRGKITALRVGADRSNDLGEWLSEIYPPPYYDEIKLALRLGYLSPGADPYANVRAGDFAACLNRLYQQGCSAFTPKPPNKPNEMITKQQAVTLLVSCMLSDKDLADIEVMCGGKDSNYLGGSGAQGFKDGDSITWARRICTAAVYKGWIPDREKLSPNEPATRGYIAALLVRAFPDPKGTTGLVIHVPRDFNTCQTIQVIPDQMTDTSEVVYPQTKYLPSASFQQSPGMVSFPLPGDDVALRRRVGSRPMEVTAIRVQKGPSYQWQLVLSNEDAARVREADQESQFMRCWRVAILRDIPRSVEVASPAGVVEGSRQ